MVKITVCIGSSCHIKGSRVVVEKLQQLVEEKALGDKIDIGGAFCMGNCVEGVCVTVDGVLHSVSKDNVDEFFSNEVLTKIA